MLKQNLSTYWERNENRLRATEVNEILAWIEYCFVTRLGPDAFEKSIVAHLSHSCQKNFTFKQIDAKVKELWNVKVDRKPGESPSDHTVIYHIGMKAFRGSVAIFNDERAQVIKARVQQLLNEPVPRYAKKGLRSGRTSTRVPPISTREKVARRLFKQKKRSGVNSARRIDPKRPRKHAITVQVRHAGFTSTKIGHD